MMTTEELENIRLRYEAATPGPWLWATIHARSMDEAVEKFRKQISFGESPIVHGAFCPEHPLTDIGDNILAPKHAVMPFTTGNGPDSRDNAIFLTYAREDVPKMWAEIRALQKDIRSLKLLNELKNEILMKVSDVTGHDLETIAEDTSVILTPKKKVSP